MLEMQRHVYCIGQETKDSTSFMKTMDALEQYVNKNFTYSPTFANFFNERGKLMTKEENENDPFTAKLLKQEIALYAKQAMMLKQNLTATYAIMWDQCSEGMKAKLTALEDFKEMRDKKDIAKLLKAIKGISMNFKTGKHLPHSLPNAMDAYSELRQYAYESPDTYLLCFSEHMNVINHYGGSIRKHTIEDIQCFNYKEYGHYHSDCPHPCRNTQTPETQLLLHAEDYKNYKSDDNENSEGLCFNQVSPQDDMPPPLIYCFLYLRL